jgi:hypothetical protein
MDLVRDGRPERSDLQGTGGIARRMRSPKNASQQDEIAREIAREEYIESVGTVIQWFFLSFY